MHAMRKSLYGWPGTTWVSSGVGNVLQEGQSLLPLTWVQKNVKECEAVCEPFVLEPAWGGATCATCVNCWDEFQAFRILSPH